MDYSPPPSGGGVSPKSPHPTIRLDDQEVIIRLKPSTYTVDAVFHLFNTAETTTEWIGFPKNATGRQPGPHGRVEDFIRFEVMVHEESVPFTEKPDVAKSAHVLPRAPCSKPVRTSSWLMGEATFPGNAMTTIRVRYESYYGNCGLGCQQAVYIYGTGRYWKDNIGKATFIVDSTEKGGAETAAPSFSPTETKKFVIHRRLISQNIAQYEIRDFEPDPQSTLSFMFTNRRPGKAGDIDQLMNAAMNGRLEQVRALLKKGVDVNARGSSGTPIMAAASHGGVQVVRLLIENGAEVNAQTSNGRTALKEALASAWLHRGQLDVAKLLVEHGAKPTTLSVAAFVGDMDAVRRFIAEGVNVTEKSTLNEPGPLMAAAMGGQADVVTFLLDKGFKVDERNEQRQTALMVAAAAGQAEVVKVLLDRGANINAQDAHRRTALNHAVSVGRGHVEVVKVLLEKGADIEVRDDPADRTILMHAAQSGHLAVVKLLLDKGAQAKARDHSGKTALDLASGKEIEEIEKVLKAHGATK